jgi:hypothetical protein
LPHQPGDDLDHLGIAPHPRREAAEVGQRLFRALVAARPADVEVDAVGVRPVALDGDGGEAVLGDQPLRDRGALGVELVRPVRCLARQDDRLAAARSSSGS